MITSNNNIFDEILFKVIYDGSSRNGKFLTLLALAIVDFKRISLI